jgi:hypothetical protein
MTIELFGGPRDGESVELENVRVLEEVGGRWTLIAYDPRPLKDLESQGYRFTGSHRAAKGGYFAPSAP